MCSSFVNVHKKTMHFNDIGSKENRLHLDKNILGEYSPGHVCAEGMAHLDTRKVAQNI